MSFQYGGFGGGGYRDPLSHGGPFGMGGMPGGIRSSPFDMGGGYAGGPPIGGGGPFSLGSGGFGAGIKRAVGWLTDKDQGSNRLALALGLAGTGAQIYGAHKAGKQQDREYRMTEEEVRRRRAREDAAAPYQQAILAEIERRRAGR